MKLIKLIFTFFVFSILFGSCSQKTLQELFDDYESYYAKGEMRSARRTIDKILKVDSTSVLLYNARGISNLDAKRYKAAIADFSAALALDDKNIFALTKRGIAKSKMKDYEDAIDDYKKAIILKGFNPISDTIYNYQVTYPDLYKDPLLFDIVYLRGKAYYETYNLFFAYDDFSLCIETSLQATADSKFDKLPECYYWRGHTLKRMGELNRACADLQIAAESGLIQAIEDVEKICNN